MQKGSRSAPDFLFFLPKRNMNGDKKSVEESNLSDIDHSPVNGPLSRLYRTENQSMQLSLQIIQRSDKVFLPRKTSTMDKSKTRNFTREPYPMNTTGRKRGLALIFSHTTFLTMDPPREAAKLDNDRLEFLLKSFGFEVKICLDYRRKQIFKELLEVSEMDHSNYDCLAIFVMTHGMPDKLVAHDDYYRVNNLWYYFMKTKCPTLKGKPKLFFIQACRGNDVDDGIRLEYKTKNYDQSSQSSSPSPSPSPTISTPDPNFFANPSLQPCVELDETPVEPDFLVAYATVPGYYSYRDIKKGSWFIQGFCDVFEQWGRKYDLLTLLTFVAQHIAVNRSTFSPMVSINDKKQMSCTVSTLERPLYFFPGEADEVSADLKLR